MTPAETGPGDSLRRLRAVVGVGVPLLVGTAHVWMVSKHYFVGSFDDDASYLLTAQAIVHGAGLTGHLSSGASVIAAYPPGYPFLLVPLLWIWPHTFTPERVMSAACLAALYPLLWVYLGRRKVGDVVRASAMVLMALSPVMATFGSMVMAEAPFLVLVLVIFLAIERWDSSPAVLGPRGIGIILAGAGLIWLKEAGIGLVVGIALWYLIRRDVRRAVAVAGGSALLLVPVVIARLVGGVPLAGARYSQELGGYYSGGLLGRLLVVAPSALVHLFSTALPAAVIPSGAPLPQTGAWATVLSGLAWQAGIFTVMGLVLFVRHHRDAAVVAVPVYLGETLLWPYINERRVLLALPIVLGWYALGIVTTGRWIRQRVAARWDGQSDVAALGEARIPTAAARVSGGVAVAALGGVLIAYPLAVQFSRDYLYNVGADSSHPQGSRYMSILASVGKPSTVVETDYESTTALFSGHVTANTAFLDATATVCDLAITERDLAADHAGYLVLGTLNKPMVIDNACLMSQATSSPFALRLLRTNQDQASVFELVGSGTAHPDLEDLIDGSVLTGSGPIAVAPDDPLSRGDYPGTSTVITPSGGQGSLTWTWKSTDTLTQISVGEVKLMAGGSLSGATLEILEANGGWQPVAEAPGVVGDGGSPYLLGELPGGTLARGMRLVVHANKPVVVTDIHALGSTAAQP